MTQSNQRIDLEAAHWAVRLHAGALAAEEQAELDGWLNADPRHRGAYVRARAQWMDLDRLAALRGPVSPIPELKLEPASGPVPGKAITYQAEVVPAVSRRQLLAASVAAIAVGGGGLSWLVLRGDRDRYTSGIGEVRRIALADGSTILLNTDTDVTVQLTKQRRDIRLIRGEALFEVAHDKSRPFVVIANDTAVRAVGTAFAVRLESTQVDVTVTEGVIEVANSAAAPGTGTAAVSASQAGARRVSANERVVVASTRAPEIRPIAPAEADRQLAWREGMVSFDGESLQTAVVEINRHNHRHIVVDDPALGARPVVGVFRANNPAGFAATVATALGAQRVDQDDAIHLRPRSTP